MVALVSVETVLLVLLVLLVAGLLRSQAEILRRLGPGAEGDGPAERAAVSGDVGGPADVGDGAGALNPPLGGARARIAAPTLSGRTPQGDAVGLDFAGAAGSYTLLAFLTTGCGTCAGFWASLSELRLPAGVEPVIVTRGTERENVARVRDLAPAGVQVVLSSSAWNDYGVPGAPYFVLVERSILGEGVAGTWTALASLVRDALAEESAGGSEDTEAASEARTRTEAKERAEATTRTPAGAARAREIDATLAAHGITPGHPSLYPAGRPGGEE